MAIDNAKIFNVRIRNKYDSYEAWIGSNLILEPGEIAIAYTTVDVKVDNGYAKHPALLMKVGDGEKSFAALPWLSAKAADVLSVCKNEEDLKTFINNVIADAGIASDEAMEALAERVTAAEGAISALELLVGNTSVQAQITATITALDLANTYEAKGSAKAVQDDLDAYELIVNAAIGTADTEGSILTKAKAHANELNTAMDERVEALEAKFGEGEGNVESQIAAAVKAEEDRAKAAEEAISGKVTTLIGEDVNKSVRTIANEELAKQLIAEGAQESLDTLQEIAAWIQKHPEDASAMNKAIADLTALIGALPEDITATTIIAYIQEVVAAERARAEEVEKVNTDAIDALEELVGEKSVATQIEEAITEANLEQYALASELDALEVVVGNAAVEGETPVAATGIFAELEKKTNDEDLAAVAKSGLIDDLSIGEGTVLIFDCGGAEI